MDKQKSLADIPTLPDSEFFADHRYAALIQHLVLDESSYNASNDYTALTFKLFVAGDVRDKLTTECAGGYPQCNGKGTCGGMWCPKRRLTDELVDLVIRQAQESEDENLEG